MNKSILIVEDEPIIADDIAMTLEKFGYQVSDIVDNAEDAILSLSKNPADLALLDIKIEGDLDGVQLASRLSIPFIFITSYDDSHTLDKVSLLNYAGFVLKPFTENDLKVNIEIAVKSIERKRREKATANIFFVRDNQEVFSIKPEDIILAEAFDNYTTLHVKDRRFIISHTLKSIEEKLKSEPFKRIHRSYLINLTHIDSISENIVFLKGHKAQIGKSYRKEFFNSLNML